MQKKFYETLKEVMKAHKKKIEIIQWAIISGIAAFVYSDYLRHLKQVESPVRIIKVPELRKVRHLLNPEEPLMEWLSNNLIDKINKHEMFIRQRAAPEFVVMNDFLDEMKVIFDLYIIPNIVKRIPETIALKFQLNNANQKQFIEDSHTEWDPYNTQISKYINKFIVEQTVLQLLWIAPSVPKEIRVPESNILFAMNENQVLVIGNMNAITPIHFNQAIIEERNIIPMLNFVTSTAFDIVSIKQDDVYRGKSWFVKTAPLNTVDLVTYGQYQYHPGISE